MRVNKTGSGKTLDDAIRPDLSALVNVVSYEVVADLGEQFEVEVRFDQAALLENIQNATDFAQAKDDLIRLHSQS